MFNFIKKYKLNHVNPELVPYFNFNDQIKIAKVIDIYDGDTITVIFDIDDKFYKYKIRLFGIDSPEMKPSKILENRDLYIQSANKVKDILKMLILNKIVKLHCKNYDKYGRILAIIYIDNMNINDFLLENKLVKKYDGKTKVDFSRNSIDFINNFDIKNLNM